MTKIEIFTGTSIEELQATINEFMEDKDVIDIIHVIDGSGGDDGNNGNGNNGNGNGNNEDDEEDDNTSKKGALHYFTIVYNERKKARGDL